MGTKGKLAPLLTWAACCCQGNSNANLVVTGEAGREHLFLVTNGKRGRVVKRGNREQSFPSPQALLGGGQGLVVP